jgi:hypothetical protein
VSLEETTNFVFRGRERKVAYVDFLSQDRFTPSPHLRWGIHWPLPRRHIRLSESDTNSVALEGSLAVPTIARGKGILERDHVPVG